MYTPWICTAKVWKSNIQALGSTRIKNLHYIFAMLSIFHISNRQKPHNQFNDRDIALINLIYVKAMTFVWLSERAHEKTVCRPKKRTIWVQYLLMARIRIGSDLIVYAWRIVKVTRSSKMILQIGRRTASMSEHTHTKKTNKQQQKQK